MAAHQRSPRSSSARPSSTRLLAACLAVSPALIALTPAVAFAQDSQQAVSVDVPNANRVGAHVREPNFGLIEIDWESSSPAVTLQAVTQAGQVPLRQRISLAALTPR